MHYPHRIRLRGPWECQALAGSAQEKHAIRVPCETAGTGLPPNYTGPVWFVRSFGYPGNIDADERIWLSVSGLAGISTLQLNGQTIASQVSGDFEFDVTKILGRHNRLEIVMNVARGQQELWSEAALEIRLAAFLSKMRLMPEGRQLRICGEVAGEGDGPMELYVLVDGRHAGYQSIAAGDTFSLAVDRGAGTCQKVRIELVNVSTIWYSWEATISPP